MENTSSKNPQVVQCQNTTEPPSKSLWKDFVDGTSLHGFKRACENTSRFRQLLWFVVFLTAVLFTSTRIVCCFDKYLRWPERVSFTLEYQPKLYFPAITFCSSNILPKSFFKDEGTWLYFRSLMNNVRGTTQEELEELRKVKTNVSGSSLNVLYHNYSKNLQLNESVVKCSWKNKDCSKNMFRRTYSSSGLCWTFNRGKRTFAL